MARPDVDAALVEWDRARAGSGCPDLPCIRAGSRWTRLLRAWRACALGAALLAGPAATLGNDQPPAAWLTPFEHAWLDAHPVVRVGIDPGNAPYAFIAEDGRFSGLSAEILQRLASQTGLRLEFVPLTGWPQVLRAARERRIDLITTASRLPERERFLAFTRPYLRTPLVVTTRVETADMVSPEGIADLRVAFVPDRVGTRRVLDRYPQVQQVPVRDTADGLAAVAQGRADALVGVQGVHEYLARQHGLTNLKTNIAFDALADTQSIAVRKDWAPLATILDKAMDRVPAAERRAIDARWMPQPVHSPSLPVGWSAEEQAWLAEAREIRVGFESDQLPMMGLGPGGLAEGLLSDTLRAVQHRTGLALRWVPGSADSLADALRRGEIDVLLHRRPALDGAAAVRSTEPLYQSSLALVCRSDEPGCTGRLDDLRDHDVLVRRHSAADDWLRLGPNLTVRYVASDADALRALGQKRGQVVLGEAPTLQRALETLEPALRGVRLLPVQANSTVQYRMAVRADWPELVTVLNRTLEQLGSPERTRLSQPWVGKAVVPTGVDPRELRLWGSAAVVLGAAVVAPLAWANSRQRREIRRRVAAETALARARDEAEAASRHKSTFVAQTSHELRTPLNAIVGACRLLGESVSTPEQRDMLGIVEGASRSLLALVDDLLDVARIEAGTLVLRQDPFDPARCLHDALEQVRVAARRKGLDLLDEREGELPSRVTGDGDRLRQVLVNLLGNAVKYTASGSVTLQVAVQEDDPGRIKLSIAVVDTGPGIPAAWRELVFEPYQRGAADIDGAAQQPRTDGVGLGLGIARQLVRAMGGELALDSEVGRGSRFSFGLDLAVAEPPSEPSDAVLAATRMQGTVPGCALLVEDNEVNMMLARMVLERGGWTVLEASTGTQALALAERECDRLDLVLTDVGLPDFDGLTLTRRLKAAGGALAALPVLGLTALAMPQERAACLDAGMVGVVLKPFDVDELWTAIARARRPPRA